MSQRAGGVDPTKLQAGLSRFSGSTVEPQPRSAKEYSDVVTLPHDIVQQLLTQTSTANGEKDPVNVIVDQRVPQRRPKSKIAPILSLAGLAALAGTGYLVWAGNEADRPLVEDGQATLLDYENGVFIKRDGPEDPLIDFQLHSVNEDGAGGGTIIYDVMPVDRESGQELPISTFEELLAPGNSYQSPPANPYEPEQTTCEIAKMASEDMMDVSRLNEGVNIVFAFEDGSSLRELTRFVIGSEC